MEIEFAKGGEIDWNECSTFQHHIMYSCQEKLCKSSMMNFQRTEITCTDEEIVDNFIKENEEELKAYFKWMQEYNSWKGE
jgi:hypothetical protein